MESDLAEEFEFLERVGNGIEGSMDDELGIGEGFGEVGDGMEEILMEADLLGGGWNVLESTDDEAIGTFVEGDEGFLEHEIVFAG